MGPRSSKMSRGKSVSVRFVVEDDSKKTWRLTAFNDEVDIVLEECRISIEEKMLMANKMKFFLSSNDVRCVKKDQLLFNYRSADTLGPVTIQLPFIHTNSSLIETNLIAVVFILHTFHNTNYKERNVGNYLAKKAISNSLRLSTMSNTKWHAEL